MDNLFVGNVGSSRFQWNPDCLDVVQRPSPLPAAGRADRLWKSLRNDPGQGSDRRPKVTGLKSESLPGFIPES
jgi:hypothetical protein